MSITDELRKWAEDNTLQDMVLTTSPPQHAVHGVLETLLRIADRIDAEHEKAVTAAHSNGITEYGSMVAREYVKLPVDADGVPIRIGDAMAYADNTKPMEVVALVPPAVFLTEDGPRYADMCRHHYAPTVEDVMVEFAIDWESAQDGEDKTTVLKEYAAKLRLAESEGK